MYLRHQLRGSHATSFKLTSSSALRAWTGSTRTDRVALGKRELAAYQGRCWNSRTPPTDVLLQRHRAGTSTTPGLLGCPCSRCLSRTLTYSDRHTTAIEVMCLLCYGTCARCPRSGQASYARLGQDLDFRQRLAPLGLKSSVAKHVPPRFPKALYTGGRPTCIPTPIASSPPLHPPHTTRRVTHTTCTSSLSLSAAESRRYVLRGRELTPSAERSRRVDLRRNAVHYHQA